MSFERTRKGKERFLLGGMPASVGAEKAVLSAVLLKPRIAQEIADTLSPSDFYDRRSRKIFEAVVEAISAGKEPDSITIRGILEEKGVLQEIGGENFLIELESNIAAAGLAKQHARTVKEKAVLRGLIEASIETIGECYRSGEGRVEEIVDRAEQRVFRVASAADTGEKFKKVAELVRGTFERIAELRLSGQEVTGISTGFKELDEYTGGFQRGDLIILAARPSMGKTAMALNFAATGAKAGMKVAFFSLEMSSQQLVLRLLSAETGVPHHRIRNAKISEEEWLHLADAAAGIASAQIFIDDTAAITVSELRARARRLKAAEGLDMIIVDYLQLLSTGGRHENRTQEISAVSRALKGLAKELDVPVIALSQLSRSLESRTDKRPLLSDLRESGAIEQDGDLIMFIYRDVVYNPETEQPDLCELIIGKQRNGPIGTVKVRFIGELAKFEDYEEGAPIESMKGGETIAEVEAE